MNKSDYNMERLMVLHRKAKAELCSARAAATLAEARLAYAVAEFDLLDSARAFNEIPIIEQYAEASEEIS